MSTEKQEPSERAKDIVEFFVGGCPAVRNPQHDLWVGYAEEMDRLLGQHVAEMQATIEGRAAELQSINSAVHCHFYAKDGAPDGATTLEAVRALDAAWQEQYARIKELEYDLVFRNKRQTATDAALLEAIKDRARLRKMLGPCSVWNCTLHPEAVYDQSHYLDMVHECTPRQCGVDRPCPKHDQEER